ncbi:MAG: hypothetical protein K0S37_3879 [Microbacterium sp.]|nr:hypothetical protein [Microbacterium sp.]
MKTRTTSTPRGGHAARGDLVIIWALVVVRIVAVVSSAGYVVNENLYAHGLCSTPPRTGCSDAPWFSSMSLSFFGGIAAVGVGAFLGLRRSGRGQCGCCTGGLPAVRDLQGSGHVVATG